MRTLGDNWEDLLQVPFKDSGDSTKGPGVIVNFLKGPANCLWDKLVLHADLIPDDQVCLLQHMPKVRVTPDVAGRGLMDVNGDPEA